MDQVKIGKFIANQRKKQNLTQEELAIKLGITAKAISKWENGRSLPDVSIMNELCEILKISLNELFAGENLKDNQIKKQAEINILDILKFNKGSIKKYKLLFGIIIIPLLILTLVISKFLLIKYGFIMDSNLKYTQIYIPNEGNIKGDVLVNDFGKISIDFDIGANKYGYAVFKNPDKAIKRLKKDYKKGIKLIQKEFHLLPLSNFNYKSYKIYGLEVTTGTREEKEQARFVSKFMDIYENSFN